MLDTAAVTDFKSLLTNHNSFSSTAFIYLLFLNLELVAHFTLPMHRVSESTYRISPYMQVSPYCAFG